MTIGKDVVDKLVGHPPIINIECECGETLYLPNPKGWRFVYLGRLEFQCPKCQKVHVSEKKTMLG